MREKIRYLSALKPMLLPVVMVMGACVPLKVLAHNVVSGAYADGMLIEGEIGFSSGDMAAAGVIVTVLNDSGEALGEVALEEGGLFAYRAKSVEKHILRANLSSGHVAEMVIEADELSAPIVGSSTGADKTNNASFPQPTTHNANDQAKDLAAQTATGIQVGVSPTELQSMIRSAVAQQVRPLQKELRAYKEKVMFRDIAGGLGFIFGLFGVAAWMASKHKDEKS